MMLTLLAFLAFSFLEENRHVIKAVQKLIMLSQVLILLSLALKEISRPLHLRKKQHLKLITGMREFVEEIISKNTIGNDGYFDAKPRTHPTY